MPLRQKYGMMRAKPNIKWDEDASRMALEDIEEKTGDAYKRFELFGVFNPISIGQRELAKIHQNPKILKRS